MSVDLKARAAQAVEFAQRAGAEDAWSTVTQSRNVQFEYRDGSLEKVKDTTSQNLGIRIYAGGRYSSHSTTDLNPERLQDFIDERNKLSADTGVSLHLVGGLPAAGERLREMTAPRLGIC